MVSVEQPQPHLGSGRIWESLINPTLRPTPDLVPEALHCHQAHPCPPCSAPHPRPWYKAYLGGD